MKRTLLVSAGALCAAGALTACGGLANPGTTTSPLPPPPATGASVPATSGGTSPQLITVPDVSGMNHQDAQNAMQAAGLYNLREADGTGKGRMLILDRDWVQVAQDPAAGTKVPPDTVITLTAVKYTDRH